MHGDVLVLQDREGELSITRDAVGLDDFADAIQLDYYDIKARHELAAVRLAQYANVQCFVALCSAEIVSTVAWTFVSLSTVATRFINDPSEFETPLLRVAPDPWPRLHAAPYSASRQES